MGKKTRCGFPKCKLNHFFVFMIALLPALPVSQSFDYGEALTKSLLYFEAQRFGRLPYNQRVRWRQNSGLTDGLEQGIFHKRMPPEAVDLVSRLLQYSPNLRCTALEACIHSFVNELRELNTHLPNGRPLPPLFNFKPQELKEHLQNNSPN